MTTMRRLAMMVVAALAMMLGHAAGDEITENPEVTAPAEDDAILLSDVSNTTNSAFGETSYIEIGTLLGEIINAGLKAPAAETLISGGVLTVTQTYVQVGAESGTADTIDTITKTGAANGDLLVLFPTSGDTITYANGTAGADNLDLGADMVQDSVNERVILQFNGTNWVQFSNSANIETVARTETESFTILEPDAVQGVSDGIVLKKFIAEDYPNGVTITAIHIDASAAYTSEAFNIEEWDASASPTPSTIELITLTSASNEDDGTLSDPDMAADGFLAVDFDDTPEDVAFVTITVTWTVD